MTEDGAAFELPMFPLGTVLFPHGILPIHVFEPRYRALVADCLAGEAHFGVVLIERGSEVGGGDARFGVGTIARIVQVGRFPDGRFALTVVGTERITVRDWLPNAPYPRALVEVRPEVVTDDDDPTRLQTVRALLTRVHALRAELGLPALREKPLLASEIGRASYEAAIAAPLGALDAQSLLEIDDARTRLERLADMLADEIVTLQFRLSE